MSDLSQDQQNRWGDSLTALIKEVNLPLLKTQEITSLPSPNTHRGTWRLEFEGHHLLKARRFMSPILAQVAYRIHQSTAAPFLPNIIAHRGDAMLEQWIPGDPLTQQTCNETTLHQAGQILATLHSATPPSTNDLNFTPPTTHTYLQKITNNIHQLAQAGAITQSKAQDLLHLANQIGRAHV